jgi:hypothetical protein
MMYTWLGKQLYISDEHERALKARARELGVSEAGLVRRMLDGLLLDGEGGGLAGAGAAEALEGFLEKADRLAESHRFQRGYVFDRNGLHEDRVRGPFRGWPPVVWWTPTRSSAPRTAGSLLHET